MTDDTNGIADNLFSIFAKFGIQLGDIGSKLDKQNSNLQKLATKSMQPVVTKIPFSGVVPANGFLVLPGSASSLNGPDQGHVWYVRKIAIGGADPTTVVAGRADVYISASDLGRVTAFNQIGIADWQDQSKTLPNIAFYGAGEMVCRFNESIYILVSGATSGQQLGGSISVLDFEEAALKQDWAM